VPLGHHSASPSPGRSPRRAAPSPRPGSLREVSEKIGVDPWKRLILPWKIWCLLWSAGIEAWTIVTIVKHDGVDHEKWEFQWILP
jgi:hypothetical protein